MNFLLVGFGGSIGVILRYLVGRWTARASAGFPLGTFIINVTGAFVLGWLTSEIGRLFPMHATLLMLFFGTGVCGAYTTFSTFSYESWRLLRGGRPLTAVAYIVASAVTGLAAAACGVNGLI